MTIRAKWLRLPQDIFGAYTQSQFHIPQYMYGKPVILRIVGLGYFRAYLNGKALSQELYLQPFSDYCARDLQHTLHYTENVRQHTIYYNEFDITSLVHYSDSNHNIPNSLFCELGCGWFKNNDRNCEGDFSFSKHLMLAFEIAVDDQVVFSSDNSTLWLGNGVVREGLYSGMDFDFNREPAEELLRMYDPEKWHRPELVEGLDCKLKKNKCRGDSVLDTLCPRIVIRTEDYTVYDCGINTIGYLTFKAVGAQEKISVEYAELCNKKDIVSIYESIENFDQAQIDLYHHVPANAFCFPRFTWYGFRYVKVVGDVTDVQVVVIGTKLENKTAFKSSNSVLNWYEKTAKHSMVCNFHMSIPTDCPHREKYPYTGDGHLMSGTMMFNYDVRAEYEKWLWDMEDAQLSSGLIPNTVPYVGGGGGPGSWGSACVLLPWNLYKAYGDKQVLIDHISMMERYLDGMISLTHEGIVQRWNDGRPFLGDWSYPDSNELPQEYINTYFLIKCLSTFKDICGVAGVQMHERFGKALLQTREAFRKKWFDTNTGSYFNGAHAADAFALDIDLGDDRTQKNIVVKYAKMKRFDTGIFGTELLLATLERLDANDVIYSLLSSTRYPSFGYWKKQGATSLWEDWSGCFMTSPGVISSRNHAMFAASQKYLYTALAGIKKVDGEIIVTPKRIHGLRHVTAQMVDDDGKRTAVEIRNGLFSSRVFIKSDGKFTLIVNGEKTSYCGNVKLRISRSQKQCKIIRWEAGCSESTRTNLVKATKAQ